VKKQQRRLDLYAMAVRTVFGNGPAEFVAFNIAIQELKKYLMKND
jgi:hypothetical protein